MGQSNNPCDASTDDEKLMKRDTGKDAKISGSEDSTDTEYGAVDEGFDEDAKLWGEKKE